MREIVSTATGTAKQPIGKCFVHLTEIERYPTWYPDGAKKVEVVDRGPDGAVVSVDAVLAAVAGPLRKEFNVRLRIETQEPTLVAFSRVEDDRGKHEALTISWKLAQLSAEETEITLDMTAYLDVPPFLPIGQVAQEAANGFLTAAVASLDSTVV